MTGSIKLTIDLIWLDLTWHDNNLTTIWIFYEINLSFNHSNDCINCVYFSTIWSPFSFVPWHQQISVDAHVRKRYTLRSLPSFLILHLVRFTKNNFLAKEKNRSVVTFPVKNLSLKDYFFPTDGGKESAPASLPPSATDIPNQRSLQPPPTPPLICEKLTSIHPPLRTQ